MSILQKSCLFVGKLKYRIIVFRKTSEEKFSTFMGHLRYHYIFSNKKRIFLFEVSLGTVGS